MRVLNAPGAYVADDAAVGRNCTIGRNVYIGPNCWIGDDCVIGPNAVIGWHGFGYTNVDGYWHPKEEGGAVRIMDDVHIGANTCVDRGSYRDTVIGSGTRIDNLVHIAHNVRIGKNCMVVAHAMLAGSSEFGDGAYIAPCVSVREHTTVGEGAFVGLGSVVVKDVPPHTTAYGVPAKPRP